MKKKKLFRNIWMNRSQEKGLNHEDRIKYQKKNA